VERAEIIREKGTNRSRFYRGQIDKYSWVDVGSSYLPSDMLAGFLYAQLEERDAIQAKRQHIYEYYRDNLCDWAEEHHVQTPFVPDDVDHAYHNYFLLLPSLEVRTRLITYLKRKGIQAVFHYLPLHLSDKGKEYGGQVGDCPVTEDVSDRLLRLPFYNTMTDDDLQTVVQALYEFTEWV
jgi:dTDP-4-amino-4,6-dideoxygalactose transaminase